MLGCLSATEVLWQKNFTINILKLIKGFKFKKQLLFYSEIRVLELSIVWLNSLRANRKKWLNTLKQFVGCCGRIV